ncbi:hypothetical protein CKO28_02565 [Rhodovibrio sodomensis]|uniref:Uncharacterized protein n=1 Tax=Rhodovibrio sodomensis TaxID=1088 RepID=A0ABS1D9A7_9PROT|nr:hypothetical protein [Rhodovibrio sodomensis]MBK1666925.1 hypothetical protein [Rhodovibrio sodomensis]
MKGDARFEEAKLRELLSEGASEPAPAKTEPAARLDTHADESGPEPADDGVTAQRYVGLHDFYALAAMRGDVRNEQKILEARTELALQIRERPDEMMKLATDRPELLRQLDVDVRSAEGDPSLAPGANDLAGLLAKPITDQTDPEQAREIHQQVSGLLRDPVKMYVHARGRMRAAAIAGEDPAIVHQLGVLRARSAEMIVKNPSLMMRIGANDPKAAESLMGEREGLGQVSPAQWARARTMAAEYLRLDAAVRAEARGNGGEYALLRDQREAHVRAMRQAPESFVVAGQMAGQKGQRFLAQKVMGELREDEQDYGAFKERFLAENQNAKHNVVALYAAVNKRLSWAEVTGKGGADIKHMARFSEEMAFEIGKSYAAVGELSKRHPDLKEKWTADAFMSRQRMDSRREEMARQGDSDQREAARDEGVGAGDKREQVQAEKAGQADENASGDLAREIERERKGINRAVARGYAERRRDLKEVMGRVSEDDAILALPMTRGAASPKSTPKAPFGAGAVDKELDKLDRPTVTRLFQNNVALQKRIREGKGWKEGGETDKQAMFVQHDRLELGRRALVEKMAREGWITEKEAAPTMQPLHSDIGKRLPKWMTRDYDGALQRGDKEGRWKALARATGNVAKESGRVSVKASIATSTLTKKAGGDFIGALGELS